MMHHIEQSALANVTIAIDTIQGLVNNRTESLQSMVLTEQKTVENALREKISSLNVTLQQQLQKIDTVATSRDAELKAQFEQQQLLSTLHTEKEIARVDRVIFNSTRDNAIERELLQKHFQALLSCRQERNCKF